ncbi:aminopeptidase [Tumebacillus sp. ITR2]|uniref:Aminopeptidase n=1 Tax=Tumebacillus amylolyticus TaxID=2801339 RepID=A0ABS1J7C4_9BACL|nr:aminopeptidase [Tumebacillus amylolyticus]MBL0386178.1 aminopeptidase [Tumebacillus amylolyticus]
MADPRMEQLAKNLIEYSCSLQPGEKILIESSDGEVELTNQLVRQAYAAGGVPFVKHQVMRVHRELLKGMTDEQVELMAKLDCQLMEQMDAYVSVGHFHNINETKGIPAEKSNLYMEKYGIPVHFNIRVKKKWVLVRVPNEAMAQAANVSTEEFEDFFFNVCTLDYAKMSRAMNPLKELMDRTDRVRIVSPGTDLTFSIKDINTLKADGKRNVPDGECFTAPIKDSVNGVIQYNTPSPYRGQTFNNIRLVFKDGKIVEATANDTEKLNEIFDTDEGARYIGEFAIGFNPYVLEPMNDILFDEKIAGSLHFTPGNAYEQADNGNRSSVHWDLVLIQRPEYGGGEIWFDDVLIRKDGLFVLPELQGLNPENLK